MLGGRIKIVADVQKVASYADVVAFMEDNMEALGTQRVAAKMAPDFRNFSIPETKMKVIQSGPDLWSLYPKICWQGDLKENRDLQVIQQEAVDDLAVVFQSVLESNGYVLVTMHIKGY